VGIIRDTREEESCGVAVGFHLTTTSQYLQSGQKEWIFLSDGQVFLRDGKGTLKRCWKKRVQVGVCHGGHISAAEVKELANDTFQCEVYAMLKEFSGLHATVMADSFLSSQRWAACRNRLLSFLFYQEIFRWEFRG
jgi:hypothetical protein